MPDEIIEHPGIVIQSDKTTVQVKIVQISACAECHVKGACHMSEMEEKVVEVEHYSGPSLQPGDQVILQMGRSMGNRAILLGYFYPFLLLVAVMITGSFLIHNEVALALVSIGFLAPYYMILYLFRSKFKTQFRFRIKA